MTKKLNLAALPIIRGAPYPAPHDKPCQARERTRVGAAAGLTRFGVNLLRLPPGAWSSQRHWHTAEDEFVFVVEGEVVLVTNDGEEILRAGDCVGFPAGVDDAHHLQNRSPRDALLLEAGNDEPTHDAVYYPDIGIRIPAGADEYVQWDGK